MNCETVQSRLTLYLLGDLDETSAGSVRTHLDACESCRAFARETQQALGLLHEALAAPSADIPRTLSPLRRELIFQGRSPANIHQRWIKGWFVDAHPWLARAAVIPLLVGAFTVLIVYSMQRPDPTGDQEEAKTGEPETGSVRQDLVASPESRVSGAGMAEATDQLADFPTVTTAAAGAVPEKKGAAKAMERTDSTATVSREMLESRSRALPASLPAASAGVEAETDAKELSMDSQKDADTSGQALKGLERGSRSEPQSESFESVRDVRKAEAELPRKEKNSPVNEDKMLQQADPYVLRDHLVLSINGVAINYPDSEKLEWAIVKDPGMVDPQWIALGKANLDPALAEKHTLIVDRYAKIGHAVLLCARYDPPFPDGSFNWVIDTRDMKYIGHFLDKDSR